MANLALFVMLSLVASATSTIPRCCVDFHTWGEHVENTGCSPEMNGSCNTWCKSTCRGGECKERGHNRHFCHCYC